MLSIAMTFLNLEEKHDDDKDKDENESRKMEHHIHDGGTWFYTFSCDHYSDAGRDSYNWGDIDAGRAFDTKLNEKCVVNFSSEEFNVPALNTRRRNFSRVQHEATDSRFSILDFLSKTDTQNGLTHTVRDFSKSILNRSFWAQHFWKPLVFLILGIIVAGIVLITRSYFSSEWQIKSMKLLF